MPITAFVIFTTAVFLVAVADVYRVSTAKLVAQNLADSAALAIAALEARSINVAVDNNEWLNNMYPAGTPHNSSQLPDISMAEGYVFDSKPEARQYAQLVATINQRQQMFIDAYNNFLGAGDQTASQNSGMSALQDILSEIKGLNDGTVQLYVWNTASGQSSMESQVQQTSAQPAPGGNVIANVHGSIEKISYTPHEVHVRWKNKPLGIHTGGIGGPDTLTHLIGSQQVVGWLEPDWSQATLQVKASAQGAAKRQIGAGAYVTKRVQLLLVPSISVQAKSVAYVVSGSGVSSISAAPGSSSMAHFRPTYYVQLGIPGTP